MFVHLTRSICLSYFLFISQSFCLKLKNQLATSTSVKQEPLEMNVNYVTPTRDLDEEIKFTEEHLNYMKKIKDIENKFREDTDIIKMLANLQNIQINKLYEIINVNAATVDEFSNSIKK